MCASPRPIARACSCAEYPKLGCDPPQPVRSGEEPERDRPVREARAAGQLEMRLTAIGTLEVWVRSKETAHRWRLEFRLRDTVAEPAPEDGTSERLPGCIALRGPENVQGAR